MRTFWNIVHIYILLSVTTGVCLGAISLKTSLNILYIYMAFHLSGSVGVYLGLLSVKTLLNILYIYMAFRLLSPL